MRLQRARRKDWWIFLALYIGSYALLSTKGAYYVYSNGGMDGGSAWIAKGGGGTNLDAAGRPRQAVTLLTFFHGPLIILDNWLVHNEAQEDNDKR